MLCGVRLRYGLSGLPGGFVSVFADDALCRGCVRAFGSQAARAFEHPQPA